MDPDDAANDLFGYRAFVGEGDGDVLEVAEHAEAEGWNDVVSLCKQKA
jgi:hypothetical protein